MAQDIDEQTRGSPLESLVPSTVTDFITAEVPAGEIEIRSEERRELGARIATWGEVQDTQIGFETFAAGSFSHVDPKKVVLRLEHEGPPVGRGISIEERSDGVYMDFRVSKTPRGDEALTLARDGVTNHVSVEYSLGGSEGQVENRNGKRVTVLTKTDLRAVATTYKPVFKQSDVMYVRSRPEGDAAMAETQAASAADPVEQPAPVMPTIDIEPMTRAIESQFERFADRLHSLEERSRSDIHVPARAEQKAPVHKGIWFQTVLRLLSGDRVSDLQTRELADLISDDNAGVMPPTYSNELIGIIDPSRPFLDSTRRLPTPDTGMSLIVPRIVTRPTVGIQETEKAQLTSTATSITSATFDAVTKGGAGDISLQLLKRSSPSYLSLYMELLAEAYAIDSDDEAVDALLAEVTVNEGGTIDPEDTNFGGAWSNAVAVSRRLAPDRIWLSSAAVAAFIDAKANGTNAPLYSNLEANFTAGGGSGGTISGLRPVHVPALDDEAVDVIVGPSRGFAWAEDGTFTLQVDVPAKAGRDVALVGILWFAPLYPAAFTTYSIAS